MTRVVRIVVAGAVLASAAGCSEPFSSSSEGSIDLTPAFTTVPVGYNDVIHSYGGSEQAFEYRMGPRGPGLSGLMGGGLNEMFVGANFRAGVALGPGHGPGRHHHGFSFGHWPFADGRIDPSCTFNASTGRVVCPPVTRRGITINKSVQYRNAAGQVQPAFDSITTNSINTQISAAGTFNRSSPRTRDSASVTVQHASDRTVTGLARGSTQTTTNGTSSGRETASGRDTVGTYTSVRVVGDTIRNIVIPITTTDSLRYPRAGSVTRQMTVTVTYAGRSPTTTTRREVVTYNGSTTATVVITVNGTSRTCTLPLPRGRLNCPSS